MPVEKYNMSNLREYDPETRLDNDKSKDVKTIGEQAMENDIVEVTGENDELNE